MLLKLDLDVRELNDLVLQLCQEHLAQESLQHICHTIGVHQLISVQRSMCTSSIIAIIPRVHIYNRTPLSYTPDNKIILHNVDQSATYN